MDVGNSKCTFSKILNIKDISIEPKFKDSADEICIKNDEGIP